VLIAQFRVLVKKTGTTIVGLFQKIVGIIIGALLIINLFILPFIVLVVGLFMTIIPIPAWRRLCQRVNQQLLPPIWADINRAVLKLNKTLQWDVQGIGTENLSTDNWYFLISNHLSATDILVLESVFTRKIPKIKFFMKRQLLWMIPMTGLACWVMGYPFVRRVTKSAIKKNPSLKGKDIEDIKKSCADFKQRPTALLSFLEGTRFTPEKHRQKRSPYRHLLRANAASFAIVSQELSGIMKYIINVTLVYPGHKNVSLWQCISGKIKKIVVRYEVLPLTTDLSGDFFQDRAFRQHLRNYLNQLWLEKDDHIESILRDNQK